MNDIKSLDINNYNQKFNIDKEIRYKYGEINTPFSLIEKMLSLFDDEIFKDKNKKWLDIGAGCGYYSIVLFKRLFNGLKEIIKDDDERKEHIIKNMIYMAELREDNWNILESDNLFTKNCNILKGDFLSFSNEDIISKTGKKYDYIIGNPPYNNNGIKKVPTNKLKNKYNNGENNNGENNTCENNTCENDNLEKSKLDIDECNTVWIPFIKKSIDLLNKNGKMIVIIPSIWMKPDKAKMYDILTSYKLEQIHCMNNTETNKIFNKLAQTPTCYFMLTKRPALDYVTLYDSDYKEYIKWNIEHNNTSSDKALKIQTPIPVFGSKILSKIVKVLRENSYSKLNVIKTNLPLKDSKFSSEKSNTYLYSNINTCKLIGLNKEEPQLIIEYSNISQSFYGKPKIIMAHKMYGFPFIDKTGEYGISNRDNYVILNKSLDEMLKLKLFFSTKLALYLFETTRYRMKYLEKYIFELIPDITLLDYFKNKSVNEINEKLIYSFFNLNEEDINIIDTFMRKNYKSF
jgi:hypothetical protein